MRDRLVEMIQNSVGGCAKHWAEIIADHLLANGVIVPPVKVGDTVHSIQECSCENIDGVHTECEFYGYGADDRICTIAIGAKCPCRIQNFGHEKR